MMHNQSTSVNKKLGFLLLFFKLFNSALLFGLIVQVINHLSRDQNKKSDGLGVLTSILSITLSFQGILYAGRRQSANAAIIAVSALCAYEISSQTDKQFLLYMTAANAVLFTLALINHMPTATGEQTAYLNDTQDHTQAETPAANVTIEIV